jgi:hypothetical protein
MNSDRIKIQLPEHSNSISNRSNSILGAFLVRIRFAKFAKSSKIEKTAVMGNFCFYWLYKFILIPVHMHKRVVMKEIKFILTFILPSEDQIDPHIFTYIFTFIIYTPIKF